MKPRLASLRVIFALVAWLAQLCLPVVHAASMASSEAGALAWCGKGASADLRAKIAQFPAEIRQILTSDATQSDHVGKCAQLCAASCAPALPEPVAITVALRIAGLEVLAPASAPSLLHSHGAPPPARGPPAYS